MSVIGVMVLALGVYTTMGVLVASAFVLLGVGRVDEGARVSTRGFRVMILPGAVALWPAVAVWWARAGGHRSAGPDLEGRRAGESR